MPIAPSPRPVWTEADFEEMGWHDNRVHAVALEYTPPYPGRVLLDIDYIVEWVHPDDNDGVHGFWISPATLVFEHASDLTSTVDLTGMAFELSLDAIVRSEPDPHGRFEWRLQGHEFTMTLTAPGYRQFLRQPPVLSESPSQCLTVEERGGFSFALS